MKHKHAELIKEWADGAEIEFFSEKEQIWKSCLGNFPMWSEDEKYRIKHEPKPDVEVFILFDDNDIQAMLSSKQIGLEGEFYFSKRQDQDDQLKLTFDGETGELKSAEVLK